MTLHSAKSRMQRGIEKIIFSIIIVCTYYNDVEFHARRVQFFPHFCFYKTVASTKSCTNRRSRFSSINNFITYT